MDEQQRKTLLSSRTMLAASTSEREHHRRKQSFDDMMSVFSDRSGQRQSVPDGDNDADATYGSLRQCDEDEEGDDSSGDKEADEVQSQFFRRMKKKFEVYLLEAIVTKYEDEESEQIGDGKLQKLSIGMETNYLNMLRESLRFNDDSKPSSTRRSKSVRELEIFQREGYEKVIETMVGGVQDEIHDA
eukprot:CAMPEP_0194327466 /NCGR_PEP_ID=MMETSP0171-20130528/41173_1 /TAXON_ID=218684 /ORGANISM="Corethron pennatum, Strain L29A3" /LENGTH=186 /DNA_ID=CAMNT_0039087427 /DNA_START=195 /DNA_END=754 /DNA_ORIENTATION=+